MEARPVALVTGGCRGIGLGIAQALAEAGFDLAIADRTIGADGEAAAAALRQAGAEVMLAEADLADIAGHRALATDIAGRMGGIDCLVNNAGIGAVVRGAFLDLDPQNFDAIVATNLRGTIFFTQAVVGAMLARRSSHARSVINITSVSAAMSSPERLDYCITKAGLSAFSQGLALSLAETGIAVFEVRPGIIRSNMTAAVSEKYDGLIADGLVPMRRWGEPADVGSIVAGLASGRFGFATGSVVNADGALSIPRL